MTKDAAAAGRKGSARRAGSGPSAGGGAGDEHAEPTPEGSRGATRGPRRAAEWVSFGISLALVLALLAHLVWRMREPPALVPIARVTPRLDLTRELEGRFVLPLEVRNPTPQTVQDVQIRIQYRAPGSASESMDLIIDYVGRSSTHTVFAYFDRDPRRLEIEAEVLSARLE